MTSNVTRRQMLQGLAIAGGGMLLGRQAASAARDLPPSEKLSLAFIGSGGQAEFSLENLADHNIVALCDVDENRAAEAFRRNPQAKRYTDYRKMLDDMHRQIDAVVVCTPDHTHAPAAIRAMRLGKHVYCEKPLTWCIAEARLMAETAKSQKVATQMGTQGMALAGARAGIEVLRDGVLGPVSQIHVWTDRAKGWWPQGVARPRETPSVPPGLDWDLWLGVAPQRPYHPQYAPFQWRGRLDFGTGAIGDMGIHNAAMVYVGLQLGLPKSIEVVGSSGITDDSYPEWSLLRLEFAGRNGQPPITMHWYDGGKKPSSELIGGREVAANGAIVVGDKGTMYSIEWTGADWHLLPEEKFRDYKPPDPTIRRTTGHHAEWIEACKGGPPPLCNFADLAAPLTEVMLLGNLALRVGRKVEWDADSMKATNCPEADRYIRREYRRGWEI